MNWSGKMWALQNKDGSFVPYRYSKDPMVFMARTDARGERWLYFPAAKVVRVQVDVKVIE